MESGYFHAADKSEVTLGKMKKVTLNGKEILILNVNGNYYAVGNECTH
jgi:nitrite reductase/ring-hydroxylating ferredoxin subunit